jgi:cellulose synthase/poly-beta-1,6-N-acetylglucosamine synthase-like glycosyltransferase
VTLLTILTVVVLALVAVELLRGSRQLASLAEVVPHADAELPTMSVVVAARDESRQIERALESLLRQRYPALEVIAVDDRSTDGTAEILDRLARGEQRLRVLHVRELPPGWLGKNHALFRGAAMATGDLLLFADADVIMEPTTLRRAASYMSARGLDHLTAVPRVLMPGALLTLLVVTFSMLYAIFVRPWRARDPKRGTSVGVGAFNLVRSRVYRAIGGHETIRMRPDDDTKLGKLIKKSGFRQEMVIGVDFISVEWYASFRELTRGLMKNGYSQLDYRL